MAKGYKTGGRVKGKPNKATTEFRMTVKALLEENAENVSKWLKLVAEGDPEQEIKPDPFKALDMLSRLAEYATPKLARTEVTGEGGGPLQITEVRRKIIDPKNDS